MVRSVQISTVFVIFINGISNKKTLALEIISFCSALVMFVALLEMSILFVTQ